MNLFNNLFSPSILVFLLIVLVAWIISSTLIHARPDEVIIISGLGRKPRYVTGRTAMRIPGLERVDSLTLKPIKIDVKTDPDNPIPSSDFISCCIDSNFVCKVDPDNLETASRHFLNETPEEIASDIQETLQGNLREIVGQNTLETLSKDRKALGDTVQETAAPDMKKLGLVILSSNIQSLEDTAELIKALGAENSSKIQRDAKLAKFKAEKEIKIAEASAQKEANEVRAKADLEIARQNNDRDLEIARQTTEKEKQILAMKQAEDVERAKADAAYSIEQAIHKKRLITEEQAAAIEQASQQEELNKKEIILAEQRLEAEIKKKADAELYQRQKEAEAKLFEEQKEAEAKLFAIQKENEAIRIKAETEAFQRKQQAEAEYFEQQKKAEAIKAIGQAESTNKRLIGQAEAEAINKIAEAKKHYGQLQMVEQRIEAQKALIAVLPDIAAAVSASVAQIDNMTLYGGSEQAAGLVPAVIKQVFDTASSCAGIDLADILMAESKSAKTELNISMSQPETADQEKTQEAPVAVSVPVMTKASKTVKSGKYKM